MMVVYRCDLCNELKECLPKEIDGRVYDICVDCWRPLQKKLKGKGRPAKASEAVFLSPPRQEPRKEKEEPFPGQPPDIRYGSDDLAQRM